MAKHKCKIPEPPMDTTRWMGTYGDMVTLLMAFFVMLFAVSETNNQKFVAFVAGLAGPFDNPAFEMGLVDGPGIESSSASPIDLIAPVPETQLIHDEDAEETAEAAAARDQLSGVREDLEEMLEGVGAPVGVDLRDSERGLVVSVSTDDVLFAVGSAEIADGGAAIIGQIAPVLAAAPNTIVIEGHTDDQPLSTAGYSNWNLSTDRAVAVLELLGNDHAIPWDRVSAAGYGEYRPLASNDTAEGRALNRRVEILIVGLDLEDAPADPEAPAASSNAPPAQVVVDDGPSVGDDGASGSDEVAGLPEPEEDGAIIIPTDTSANSATLATIMGQ